jgi:hypothetical protein
MLVKIVILFLAGMVLIALVGRVLFPGALPRVMRRGGLPGPKTCPTCGRYLIGKGGCDRCRPRGRA